jgi:hypothetical protein
MKLQRIYNLIHLITKVLVTIGVFIPITYLLSAYWLKDYYLEFQIAFVGLAILSVFGLFAQSDILNEIDRKKSKL